jgi:hypothetical protein
LGYVAFYNGGGWQMKKFVLALALVISTAGYAAAAPIDPFAPITFSLNDPNAALVGFPLPFGGVIVDWMSSTTASIVFLANESHANAITFGGQGAVDLNVNINGTGVSVSPISEFNTLSGFDTSVAPSTTIGAQNIDGRGSFNVVVDNFDGFMHSATQFAFTLTNLGGTWASSSDVLKNNADNNEVAVHAFICNVNAALCNANSGATATGFVADGLTGKPTPFDVPPSPVPEPTSMALLGSGLVFLANKARRKQSV